jgi:hypothetical protein
MVAVGRRRSQLAGGHRLSGVTGLRCDTFLIPAFAGWIDLL